MKTPADNLRVIDGKDAEFLGTNGHSQVEGGQMGVKVKEWKGAWWVFINFEKRRKSKRVGTGEAGKKAAKQAAAQIQARLALGQFEFEEPKQPKPDIATVGSYLRAWLKEHAAVNCKPSTFSEYQWCIEHVLVPEFGALPLSDLNMSAD